jgi:hypothetical protein
MDVSDRIRIVHTFIASILRCLGVPSSLPEKCGVDLLSKDYKASRNIERTYHNAKRAIAATGPA